MALYDDLCFFDILGPIQDWLDEGAYWINLEGQIEGKITISHRTPWLHARMDFDRHCNLWAKVMFSRYGIIPKGCQNCWKVVAVPRTLKEAFGMLELQKELGFFSKTGMEQRNYSGRYGGWSSFWYAPLGAGLEGARELFAFIKGEVEKKFDKGLSVTLKRACTEMEMKAGPSDKWEYSMRSQMKEDMLNAVFAPQQNADHPKFVKVNVERRWVEWGMAHSKSTGDKTYLEYVEKDPLFSMVNYNGTIHNDKDFCVVKRRTENDRDKGPNDRGSKACSCSREGDVCDKCDKPAEGILLV